MVTWQLRDGNNRVPLSLKKREIAVRRSKMPPVLCYICGRQFGTKSIKIHIPNCEERWEIEQGMNKRRTAQYSTNAFQTVEIRIRYAI